VVAGQRDSASTSNFNSYMVLAIKLSAKWVFAVSFKNWEPFFQWLKNKN
jgi:hypothetical protein